MTAQSPQGQAQAEWVGARDRLSQSLRHIAFLHPDGADRDSRALVCLATLAREGHEASHRIASLSAENRRMREALTEIADWWGPEGLCGANPAPEDLREWASQVDARARAALAPQPVSGEVGRG